MQSTILAGAAALAVTAAASAAVGGVDLQLDAVRVSQAIRYSGSPVIAQNVTYVRAIISTPGFGGSVADVDAVLRVYVNGNEASFSPVYSINGPIVSPNNPSESDLNDHVNFWFIAPFGFDVDIEVEVNPFGAVPETNLSNNTGSVDNLFFECRGTTELVYVPIDYVPGGGLPDEALIEPGIGDGFVRAIFKTGSWNYHRFPGPPLVWTQDINGSNGDLLNELEDIRVNTLPGLGYSTPPFIYGWLKDNPFGGNGQANGIPGNAAFGNTETSRHQRTFAHEMGHLLDEPHNGEDVGQIGIDVEHHLIDTENLDVLHASSQNDIMVAGQLTNTAFVSDETYNQVHDDPRLLCGPAPLEAGSPAMLRVSGVLNHVQGGIALDPVSWIERGTLDEDRPAGLVWIIARDAAGNELYRRRAGDGSARALCSGDGTLDPRSPLHALIPATPNGVEIASIDVVEVATGLILAQQTRSPNPPAVAFTSIANADGGAAIDPVDGAALTGRVRVEWTATDPDGDALEHILQYSHNGGESWIPLVVNHAGNAFEFDADDVARTRGAQGRLRLVTTDGLNNTVTSSPALALGGAGAPEVFLITPNDGDAFAQGGNVILHGYAYDNEDLAISNLINWTSSIDGAIGSGRLIQLSSLSPGTHTLTATVADTDSNTDARAITITITPRDLPGSPDLDGDGSVGFNDLLILLASWGPCAGACPADLDGDGSVGFNDLLALLAAWG